ncbi:ATP-dependent sacrificial sulfur transferase LarE [Methanobrevibacter sp. TMH8]|uniref:ATP-dependent sacrificial sulfur transferase LarE n=1 Tax=Methanobrevibacter sp. TMH8 TaxID=2848611 RepID=UPI001CC9CCDD|nr:ATP-dependent sacrificial sulfur transferase LarE [Methanobrevibacter sp. TMH8]MBZ9569998.1 ATP-dependent sacrificial sulfur transferase LarE [Methanobrevibacter sp. TMH8]
MDFDEKIEKVENIMRGKNIVIAFSGGADSTMVTYIANKVANKCLAITFNNEIMPTTFLADAKRIAKSIGIKHEIIDQNFLEIDKFKENKSDRCYLCRNIMYSNIKKSANENGYETIVDGTNISDLLEDRPGIMVNYENNILSPLVNAGIEKEEVIEFLNKNNIEYSKSTTCLATRIKTGEEITGKKINRIKYAEDLLKNLTKDDTLRVRDISNTAQIETENIDPLLNKKTLQLIESELKAVNFEKITLDVGTSSSEKKEIVIYKPCKDEANKIMFENELPYKIDISKTCPNLENLGKLKCSEKMGVAMIDIDGKNITLFENGKIVARKVKDKEDAQNILIKVLPLIRRVI